MDRVGRQAALSMMLLELCTQFRSNYPVSPVPCYPLLSPAVPCCPLLPVQSQRVSALQGENVLFEKEMER